MDHAANQSGPCGRLLLLRGLTRESGHWGTFTSILQECLPDWEVLTLDLPGTGSRFQDSPGHSVGDYAQAMLDQLALHPPKSTVAVGMSLGGMVTLEMLHREPRALVGGVLINTSEASMSRWHERISPRALIGLMAALASPSLRQRESLVHRMTSINPQRGEQESKAWVQIARARPVAKRVLAAQIWAAARYRAPKQIHQPLLWLASEQDRFVALACTQRLWKHYGGDFHSYPFAGHDLSLDAPRWTARVIREFLQKKVDVATVGTRRSF